MGKSNDRGEKSFNHGDHKEHKEDDAGRRNEQVERYLIASSTHPTGYFSPRWRAMISRRVQPSGASGSSPGSMKVSRQWVDLSDTGSFGQTELKLLVDLPGRTWVRLQVWDVAGNGAFTQPVCLKPADSGNAGPK